MGGAEVTYFYVGDAFHYAFGSKYSDFQDKSGCKHSIVVNLLQ